MFADVISVCIAKLKLNFSIQIIIDGAQEGRFEGI